MSEFLADAQERSTILKVVHRRVMNRSVVLPVTEPRISEQCS